MSDRHFEFRPARAGDLDHALHAIQEAFAITYQGEPDPDHFVGALYSNLYHRPGFDPSWVKVALDGRRVVSVLGTFPRPSYIDGAVVQTWIIDPAATLHEYRGLGLLPRLMQMTLNDLAARGCSLVFFHGVPSYYSRFGFTHVMPFFRSEAPVSIIPGPAPVMRPADEADIPGIAGLYDRQARRGFLALLRSERWWLEELSHNLDPARARHLDRLVLEPQRLVVLGAGREVRAYAVLDFEGSTLIIREGAADGPQAAEEAIRALAGRARQEGLGTLTLAGAPRTAIARALYEAGGQITCKYPRPGFARIIHLKELLRSMRPTLLRRYVGAGLDWSGRIDLGSGPDSAGLLVSPQGIDIVDGCPDQALSLDYSQLVRMVCGYTAPMDSSPVPEMPGTEAHVLTALRALFPMGHPSPDYYMY